MSESRAHSLIAQAIAAVKAGDALQARLRLRQALELEPRNPEAWLWQAGVAENPAAAARSLVRCLELDPNNVRAKAGLRVARFEAGVEAAKANRRGEARDLLQRVTADDPKNEAAWLWLAGATDDPIQAIGHLERALQINPKNERARAGIETFRARAKSAVQYRCPICEAQANGKFTTCPNCKAVLDLACGDQAIGNPCPDLDMINRGANRLEAAVRERRDFTSNYYLGMALLNLGRPDESVDYFRAAMAMKPGDAGLAAQIDTLERALAEVAPPTLRLRAEECQELDDVEVPTVPAPDPKSVLVVDDSSTIRKLVGITLRRNGYRMIEANDSREAMEIVECDGKPDAFVLDVGLSGMDGYTFCRSIRDNPETSEIPVIMLTARDTFLDRMRGRMSGSNEYVTKPFKPEALMNAVRQCCPLGSGKMPS